MACNFHRKAPNSIFANSVHHKVQVRRCSMMWQPTESVYEPRLPVFSGVFSIIFAFFFGAMLGTQSSRMAFIAKLRFAVDEALVEGDHWQSNVDQMLYSEQLLRSADMACRNIHRSSSESCNYSISSITTETNGASTKLCQKIILLWLVAASSQGCPWIVGQR